jgi:cobalt-zinc-cadmium efflux system membrane fusion protein
MNEEGTHMPATLEERMRPEEAGPAEQGNLDDETRLPDAPVTGRMTKGWKLSLLIVLLGVTVVVAMNVRGAAKPDGGTNAASTDTVAVSQIGQSVVRIQTAPVQLTALDDKVAATGLVTYPADSSVKIAPRLTGRVRQIFVQVGDHVAAGQPVAVIESPDASGARATETQNEANLRLAQDALQRVEAQFRLGTPEVTSAQAAYDQAKSNAAFSKDALAKVREQSKIGGFTQQPLENATNGVVTAESSLTQAQADLDTAERAHDRMVKLVAIGVNSQQDLDNAANSLAHAQANVEANRSVFDLARQALAREQKAFKTGLYANQALISAESSYRQAVLQETAAARALAIAKASILADLQQAQNGYRNAAAAEQGSRAALTLLSNPGPDGRVTITAPVSGVVVERDANAGQMVDQSQMTPWQLMVISNNAHVWVGGDIYEKDLSAVRLGQPVTITVDAYPNRAFSGVVARIAPTVNAQTRAVTVRADIPNAEGLLKDGMFAEMTILTGRSAAGPVIPIDAVQHDADTEFVYVKDGEKYVRRNVRLGGQKNGQCLVAAGLRQGEQVVTRGALLLGGQVEND